MFAWTAAIVRTVIDEELNTFYAGIAISKHCCGLFLLADIPFCISRDS
jgi:hypothetical protein